MGLRLSYNMFQTASTRNIITMKSSSRIAGVLVGLAKHLSGLKCLTRPLKNRPAIAFVIVWILINVSSANARECPEDWPKGVPCLQAWETVKLEHQDRVRRMLRLGKLYSGFEFYESEISPKEHGLADFPTALPILRVIGKQDVFFDSGSAVIRDEAYPLLDIIADSLKREPPDVSLFVAGHTDSDGSEEYNMKLGLDRAQAVAANLVRRGIYQAEIYRISFGEYAAIDSNKTARGKARNRRVEFLFSANTAAILPFLEKQQVILCRDQTVKAGDQCKKKVTFTAERIEVSIKRQKLIASLEREMKNLEIDTRIMSKDEIHRERKAIELKREKIPVTIGRKVKVVHLGR